MTEPDWLVWAREIQGIAQSGLTFTKDQYDRERYEQLRRLAAEIMASHSSADATRIEALFAAQSGYATPKIDVRGAAFRAGKILMVREVVDNHRWTLPGGWADVNLSAAENCAKEMIEESGFVVRVTKLAAAWDHSKQGHVPPNPFSTLKMFFLCDITGGEATPSAETSEIGFFGADDLPDDLSTGRVIRAQILRMFVHHANPGLQTDFE
jgi:ADP-ribose pyrophosphatase YjhB (NUDIX family)